MFDGCWVCRAVLDLGIYRDVVVVVILPPDAIAGEGRGRARGGRAALGLTTVSTVMRGRWVNPGSLLGVRVSEGRIASRGRRFEL